MSARPIVVLAAPFCGSSWLAAALGTLPGAYAAPQLLPWMADDVGTLQEIFELGQGEHGDGLRRLVAELLQDRQPASALQQADAWLQKRAAYTVAELLAELSDWVAPRRLVIPDAETALRPLDLRRLQHTLPDAELVHLVRHPWTQGVRMAAALNESLFVPPDYRDYSQHPPLVEPQIPWLRANDNIERLLATWPQERVHRIRSEDLARDYSGSLGRLAAELGLSGEPGDPASWVFAGRGPRLAPGGLEADVWLELSTEAEALSQRTTLVAALPWRPDGAGFDAAVCTRARHYGYG